MSRIIRLAAVAAVLFAAPAMAQNMITELRPGAAPGPKGAIRINVGMNFFVTAPTDDSEAAVKAQEQARRIMYQSAAAECDVLRATIAGDCRLESIGINVNRQYGSQIPQGFNVNGSFVYHVTLK